MNTREINSAFKDNYVHYSFLFLSTNRIFSQKFGGCEAQPSYLPLLGWKILSSVVTMFQLLQRASNKAADIRKQQLLQRGPVSCLPVQKLSGLDLL